MKKKQQDIKLPKDFEENPTPETSEVPASNTPTSFWEKLNNLYIFEKFVRGRTAIILYSIGGLILAYLAAIYFIPMITNSLYTVQLDKKTREKTVKMEKERSKKYDKIEKENIDLKKYKNNTSIKVYKMDLIMRLYDYYKDAGTLQTFNWINKKLFEEVYDGAVSTKALNPSFDKVYFRAYPAEESALKTIVIRHNPDVSGDKLEKLIDDEEKRYLNLVYPLVIFGKCKKESNFNRKCEATNYRKDNWGNFILDKSGKKQFKSVDQGIVQINYCGQCGGNKAKCISIKDKPMGDGYCTRAWLEDDLKKKRPDIAYRDIFDIEKNLAMRAIHTENLIKNYQPWCFIDWDFTGMLKRVMWNAYYPEMFELVGY